MARCMRSIASLLSNYFSTYFELDTTAYGVHICSRSHFSLSVIFMCTFPPPPPPPFFPSSGRVGYFVNSKDNDYDMCDHIICTVTDWTSIQSLYAIVVVMFRDTKERQHTK